MNKIVVYNSLLIKNSLNKIHEKIKLGVLKHQHVYFNRIYNINNRLKLLQ